MSNAREKNISRFNEDARDKGYLYTQDKLSSRLANRRMTNALLDMVVLKGKCVADVGCGDGTYTRELMDFGPASVTGFDAASDAVKLASRRYTGVKGLKFETRDVYRMGELEGKFDVAVVRGLLHHLYDSPGAIEVVSGIAPVIVVLEPNGYNPVLKVMEKVSAYHRAHEEKSYAPHKLDRWFELAGGRVEAWTYTGLVPFFCPDIAARILKVMEPVVESLPLLKQLGCAQYVFKVTTGLGRQGEM